MAAHGLEVLVAAVVHPELLQVVCQPCSIHLYPFRVILFKIGRLLNLHAKVAAQKQVKRSHEVFCDAMQPHFPQRLSSQLALEEIRVSIMS